MKIGQELSEIGFESLKMMHDCNSVAVIQTFIIFKPVLKIYLLQIFWSLADEYPDLVTRLHTQARLMGSFGLNGSVPWLKDTEVALCFICKEDVQNTYHYFLDCPQFKEKFDSVWRHLQLKITRSSPTDGIQIANFIKNLNRQNEVMLLAGGLSLPFDNQTTTLVKKFISSAVGKIYKLRTWKLRELEAPWLKD